MTERPILFSAPMVRALLAGTKSQTRRIVKPQFAPDALPVEMPACDPIGGWVVSGHSGIWWCEAAANPDDTRRCPYGKPGDRLWVKETWAVGRCANGLKPAMLHGGTWLKDNGGLWYAAGGDPRHPISPKGKTRPSIFMPRWASRITLEVTGTRVQRLQDISEADAVGEGIRISSQARRSDSCYGIYECQLPDGKTHFNDSAYDLYRKLWESINGPGSWAANPYVWVIAFKKL